MIATHLGVIEEEKIDNMSYVFFVSILKELGKKLRYEAVVNYAGNSFMEKSWDVISDANPMNADGDDMGRKRGQQGIADFLGGANIKTVSKGGKLPGKGFNGRDRRGK